MRESTSRATAKNSNFVFFGGKGGVGKTTCAAAYAVAAIRGGPRGRRVLVVSTDPAHSLGDALRVRLTARPTPVPGAAGLEALELDGARAFARWIAEHGPALGDAIEHGTWLDRADVDELLALPIPGVDELVGMLEIVRLAQHRYDAIVVDTAPTGHALRLLASPDAVAAMAAVLDTLQYEHRVIRARFGSAGRPEAADRLVALLAEQAGATGDLLRDPERTAFHWVMLPEALSLAESEDGVRALAAARIRVAELVVNRVIPAGPACRICDRRRAEERRVIAAVRRGLARGRTVTIVPSLLVEPRGTRALDALAAARRTVTRSPAAARGATSMAVSAPVAPPGRALNARLPSLVGGARLVFVGGKGGVGKTTVAAATALQLTRAEPQRRVLLLSTDPAHSLGDVFGAAVGDAASLIVGAPRNLLVRELDAPAALAARRAQLEAAINEIVNAFGASAVGSRGVAELMDLAPPGIDELFGLVSVLDLLDADYDTLIVDTAPTGHALRLLELPGAAREWVQVLLRVLLKYRELVRPGQLAAELVELSRQVRSLNELLRTPELARFVVVTRAAEVPRLETERLMASLRKLRISAPVLVVNALTLLPGRCPRCRATATAERRQLATLARICRRPLRRCAIIHTPLAAPPPRRVAALERWARTWTA